MKKFLFQNKLQNDLNRTIFHALQNVHIFQLVFLQDKVNRAFDHPLYLNKFGIPEPKKDKKVVPNILIIPLVAFDKHLNRLGYGGGYYDRLLKKMENNKLLKIGLAFSYQKVKKLPVGIYDKKLDYVITEKGLFK